MHALLFTRFVDGDDVAVFQTGRGLGLRLKPFDRRFVGELGVGDDLDGHDPVQAPLPGPIDDPHPSPRDSFEQLVVIEQ